MTSICETVLIVILAVMISVLIPVYNYNVVPLVTHVHTQLELCNFPFEIICYDDCSSAEFTSINNGITNLNHTSYIIGKHNVGRTKARQYLAETATSDWLLFIDADVIPKKENYISRYIDYLKLDFDTVYGGFAYHEEKPEQDYILRWKYGTKQEQPSARLRNKKPYKVVISANFLIRKSLFLDINSKIDTQGYGYDNFFGAELKSKQVKILHIDNEVYHLGLESNAKYLRKTEQAVDTLLFLFKKGKMQRHQNTLLHIFSSLKRFGVHRIVSWCFELLQPRLKKNLTGDNPSIFLFQMYKIGYMCYKERSK